MIVAFDADMLSLALNPSLEPPIDPGTQQPVQKAAERLEYLIADLEKSKTRVIIPAPALGEFLVIAEESGPDYLVEIDKKSAFSIEPFDTRPPSRQQLRHVRRLPKATRNQARREHGRP